MSSTIASPRPSFRPARRAAPLAATKYPPGPPNGLFGWRHVGRLKNDLLGFASELQRQYGDCVSYRIGPIRLYQFSHPEQVSEIHVKQADAFHKPQTVKTYFKRWMRTGLLLNEGPDWQQQRRKVRYAMQQMTPDKLAASIAAETSHLAADCQRGEVDVAAAMDRLAFGLNVRALLGIEAPAAIEPLHAAANVMHATGIAELESFSPWPDWLPIPSKNRLRRAMRTFDDILLDAARRREATARGSAEHSGAGVCDPGIPVESPVSQRPATILQRTTNPDDLLGQLLVAHDRSLRTVGMSPARARDEAVNLLMGGKETVGSTLTFATYLLAMHPEVQDRAADEVQREIGDRPLELTDLPRLPEVTRVIQETMRLYPPVYALTRQVAKPVTIAGYRLRRGSMVMVPLNVVHSDARWWDEPHAFRPERFSDENETHRPPYVYLPFGAGPRSCVGKQMGQAQCVLVLADLLRRFQWRLAPGQGTPRLKCDIVVHPSEPLRLAFARREA
ncbi:MAG: cytochrome P450 [Pirellulales bacterium]